jgi:hypothetical protein
MNIFKIGDKVIGNEKARRYGITTQGWVGIVTNISGDCITVEPLSRDDSFDVLAECFDLYGESELCIKISTSEMRVLLRHNYQWVNAIYDEKHDVIITTEKTIYKDTDIIAVKNDERSKYVKCDNCGSVIEDSSDAIETHMDRYKSLDFCLGCRHLSKHKLNIVEQHMEKRDDGFYNITPTYKYRCSCYALYNETPIDEAKSDGGQCLYRTCNSFHKIQTFHSQYPNAFNKIATVDSLADDKWTYRDKTEDYFRYKARKRFTVIALVNKFGIIDRFIYKDGGNNYEFMYSCKYNKLFWLSDTTYIEENANVSESRQNEIINIVSEIYKGE